MIIRKGHKWEKAGSTKQERRRAHKATRRQATMLLRQGITPNPTYPRDRAYLD